MPGKSKSGDNTFPESMAEKVEQSPPADPAGPAPAPGPLNFHSPEFNRRDDLDDNLGNYREFDSLEGVVTADMRHQEERRLAAEQSGREDVEVGEDAGTANAEEVLEDVPPPPVTVFSEGRTLIISPDADSAVRYGELLAERGLSCILCVVSPGSGTGLTRSGSLVLVRTGSVVVRGAFAGFTAAAGEMNLARLLEKETEFFDLVLDLQSSPSYAGTELPLGYYAPRENNAALEDALAELPVMRGRFTKPSFTGLQQEQCLHGRSEERDCRRCVEICPVGAVSSEGGRIVFDPVLCQGCGGCALVCPADAVRMRVRQEVRPAIADFVSGGRERPRPLSLVLQDSLVDPDALRLPDDRRIIYRIEEIADAGLDTMLAALAYGADSVTLVCSGKRAAGIRDALREQVVLGRTILREIGMQEDRVRFTFARQDGQMEMIGDESGTTGYAPLPVPAATFDPGLDRRSLIRLAVEHLCKVSGNERTSIPLPENTPFGTIEIEADSCSLCMSCVGTCPPGALAADGEVPRITLVESECHQCGLCLAVCPEEAIRLQPRILISQAAATTAAVLVEEEPFSCIECGVPFASPAMIRRMEEKLAGHWMYGTDRQVRRLKMCRTCRTRDALTAGDYGR
jgi:ferredoxin